MSDEIELRGAGNQAVIGRVPTWLVKWGNLVILSVLFVLLFVSFRFTFPVIEHGSVHITEEGVYIVIPLAKLSKIADGQDIGLRMDDYPHLDYGILQGKVSLNQLILKDATAFIPVILDDHRNAVKHIYEQKNNCAN